MPPAVTVCEPGEADTEKSGFTIGFTTRVIIAWLERLPLVPVTVTVYVPAGVALAEVETVSIDEPDPPLTDAGAKLALAPAGNPATAKPTSLVKPPEGVTVAV